MSKEAQRRAEPEPEGTQIGAMRIKIKPVFINEDVEFIVTIETNIGFSITSASSVEIIDEREDT